MRRQCEFMTRKWHSLEKNAWLRTCASHVWFAGSYIDGFLGKIRFGN